jgi:hypothetical protein
MSGGGSTTNTTRPDLRPRLTLCVNRQQASSPLGGNAVDLSRIELDFDGWAKG